MAFENLTGGYRINQPDLTVTRVADRYGSVPWSRGISGLRGMGLYGNTDLAPEAAKVQAAIGALTTLNQSISGAISSGATVLQADPTGAGAQALAQAQSAQATVQGALQTLQSALWNGQNFGSFAASDAAWHAMDSALGSTAGVATNYSSVVGALAQAVTAAKNAAQAAAQSAQQQRTSCSTQGGRWDPTANYCDMSAAQAAQQQQAQLLNQQQQAASQQQAQLFAQLASQCSAGGGTWNTSNPAAPFCDMSGAIAARQAAVAAAQQAASSCSQAGGRWDPTNQYCDMSAVNALNQSNAQATAQAAAQQATLQAQLQQQQAQFQAQQDAQKSQIAQQAVQACINRGGNWTADGGCDMSAYYAQQQSQQQFQQQQVMASELPGLIASLMPLFATNPQVAAQILAAATGGSISASVPGQPSGGGGMAPSSGPYQDVSWGAGSESF